jgi:hypothetical protein
MNPVPDTQPEVSQEFYIRVNDFIEMANRIERRFDTAHAQVAMLNGFARYSGHHYRSTVKLDTRENREQFADYIGNAVKNLVLTHLENMTGPPNAGTGADAAAE